MLKRRFLSISLLCLAVAGCASASPTRTESDVARLTSDKGGIVLMRVDVAGRPATAAVALARREDDGRYRQFRVAYLKFASDRPDMAGQIELEAGEYGIVQAGTTGGRKANVFSDGEQKSDGLFNRYYYDRPIVTFRVGPGEVVDIGSLRLIEGPRARPGSDEKNQFGAEVGPLPRAVLEDLEKHNPHLFKRRIVRPMVLARAAGG